jgi:hypothetical protein
MLLLTLFNTRLLILAPLASQPLDLGLVSANLAVLLVISILLTLELVADQRARAQAEAAADQRARRRVTHSAADNAPCGGSSEGSDTGAFFARGQRPAGAAHGKERRYRKCREGSGECRPFHFISSFFGRLFLF